MKGALAPMNGRWNKALLLLVGLLVALPAGAAQPESDLPALNNVSADATGMVAFFYPAGWLVEPGDEQLQIQADSDSPLTITVEVVPTSGQTVDDLPDWMIAEADVPDTAFFSPVTYSGFDGWIAQGEGLFEPEIFTAVAVVQVTPQQSVLIRTDFPAEDMVANAPLITAMLEKMVILPGEVTTATQTVHLPLNWQYTETESGLFAGIREADLIERVNGGLNTPSITLNLSRVGEDGFEIPQRNQRETMDFLVNEQPAQVILQRDATTSELFITSLSDDPAPFILHASAIDPRLLVDNLSLFQAIFSTIRAPE